MTGDRGAPSAAAHSGQHAVWAFCIAAGAIAVVVAGVAMKAWLPAMNDPDSMSSVLYFQRIVAGRHLEVTVLTTPKPLLTFLYGITWSLVHDWRVLVWETLAVHGLAVALATRLAARLAGIAAAAFVAALLILSGSELLEVSQANSLPWALAGWLLAGLAVTVRPRRFGMAGIALMLAGMARVETWLILGAATVVVAALAVPSVRSRLARGSPTAADALPILVGWIALPVQLLHDQLLTGNPLYWLSVPSAYTALVTPNLRAVGPLLYLPELVRRYAQMPLAMILFVAGAVVLAKRRQWAISVGLVALVGGGLFLLVTLAWRGIFISDRYFEEPDFGILFGAGIGVGALCDLVASLWRARAQRLSNPPTGPWLNALGIGAAGIAVGLALLVARPNVLDPQIAERFAELRAASADLDQAMPRIRQAMATISGPDPPVIRSTRGFTIVDPARADMFTPRPLQRRIAVELGVSLTRLADSSVAFAGGPLQRLLHPGQFVYHDAHVDGPAARFAPLEVTVSTSLGNIRLIPLAFQARAYWLLLISR